MTKNSKEQFEEYQKLKQECKELKKELATYKKLLDNPEFRVALTDIRTGERDVWRKLGSKVDRYRKALEEIEEYIKEEEWSLLDYVVRDINDIINKARGGGECQ